MTAKSTRATRCCSLCARPGDFGPIDSANPRSRLCPACQAAALPVRDGLERAVVTVAEQNLADAQNLELETATPREIAYYFGALQQSVLGLLQLVAGSVPQAQEATSQ